MKLIRWSEKVNSCNFSGFLCNFFFPPNLQQVHVRDAAARVYILWLTSYYYRRPKISTDCLYSFLLFCFSEQASEDSICLYPNNLLTNLNLYCYSLYFPYYSLTTWLGNLTSNCARLLQFNVQVFCSFIFQILSAKPVPQCFFCRNTTKTT